MIAACGTGADEPSAQISVAGKALCAGGGCGSTLTGNTVPTTLAPSEKLIVDVTLQNTGTVTWDGNVALRSRTVPLTLFGVRQTFVAGTVAPGASFTFSFVITSPAALGPATFDFQLFDFETGQFFGDRFTQVITIQNQTPNYGCTMVSETVPEPVVSGSSYNVSFEIENTGLQPWPGATFFFCETDGRIWSGTKCRSLPGTIAPGGRAVINATITAPMATGSIPLTRQIFDYSPVPRLGAISDVLNCVDLTVTVNAAGVLPLDAMEDVGSRVAPASLTPGQQSTVTVVMQNTGTTTWLTDGSFALIAQNTSFGSPRVLVQNTTATGATSTFVVPIQAPATAGSYTLDLRMNNLGGGGAFGPLVSIPIDVVGATPTFDAAEEVAGRDVPAAMFPGETRPITIAMRNTGTQAWTAGAAFSLAQTDNRLFGNNNPILSADTAANAVATFNFLITAPATEGNYNLRRRMNNSGGVGLFGTEVVIPISVSTAVVPQYTSEVVSQVYPARFSPNEMVAVDITMRNSGTATWTGSTFILRSQNTPSNLWVRTSQGLGACDPTPPGGTCTFTLDLVAPAAVGTYDSIWRMEQIGGVGLFGATASQTNIPVTFCGNGIVEGFATPPETCDYGDVVDGDGCSSTCQFETQLVDLPVSTVGRTFRGSSGRRQLGTVTSGNIDGDGSTELLLGENGSFLRGTLRNSAGRVAVYEAPALDSSTTVLPTGATLEVLGAEGGDGLAALASGRIIAADVTGDGIDDLVTSAPKADGMNNARVDSGEVYVLPGGAALTATAAVDLLAPGTFLSTKFEGAAAGDNLTVLAAGDVTGDGVADLILGAALNDTAAADAGIVYVIQGGASLAASATIDLASAMVYATITGVNAADGVGYTATVGNIVGGADPDLVIGVDDYDVAGRTTSGAVFVFQGPMASGAFSLAARDLEIQGAALSDRLGSALAIGDVTGSTDNELIMGAPNTRFGGNQIGSVEILVGPITIPMGGVIDLAATPADIQIQGVDPGDRTGGAVAVGDFDGNGFDDIAVGAPLAAGPGNAAFRAGEVTLVLGAMALPATISLATLQGGQPPLWVYGAVEDRIGSYDASLHFHDIDGDGIEDLCVGVIRAFAEDDGAVYCIESQFD